MTTMTYASGRQVGPNTPVPDEIEAFDLEVEGALPVELTGSYLRNGPNPLPGEAGHWFTGHGMVHGIGLDSGCATWYRNRWVRTAKLAGGEYAGPNGVDLAVNPANTSIIEHGGALLALCEGGLPYRLTRDLQTVGPDDFGGRLLTAMTAHPKRDPQTGTLYFYGYAARPPFVTFHVADATGRLVHSEPIPVRKPSMMHDFAITEHHVVWLDLPVTFDLARLAGPSPTIPYAWDDGYGARIGIMARTGGPVTWVEIEPCYVFHVGNAHEDAAGRIVLDAVRYSEAAFAASWGGMDEPDVRSAVATTQRSTVSTLHRWTIDLGRDKPGSAGSGTVSVHEEQLDDRHIEFPSLNDDHVGRASRYRYAVSPDDATVVKYDLQADSSAIFETGVPGVTGEASFVPAADARAEDDGWLLTLTTPADGGASELLVFDASAPADRPVARVHLPRRVPAGFHGAWVGA